MVKDEDLGEGLERKEQLFWGKERVYVECSEAKGNAGHTSDQMK